MELPTTSNVSIPSDASGPVQPNETAEEEKSSTIANTEEMEAAKLHDIIFASADTRQKATEARWSETIDDDSGDEAFGSSIKFKQVNGAHGQALHILAFHLQ